MRFDRLCDWLGCRRPRLVLGVFVQEQAGPAVRSRPRKYRGPKRELMGMITITDSQQVLLTVKAVDKKGNPTATASGSVSWFVDNTDLLSILDHGDGTATLKAVGPIGAGTVSVKATVGGTDVAGHDDVSVVSGAPVQLTIAAGTPEEQP